MTRARFEALTVIVIAPDREAVQFIPRERETAEPLTLERAIERFDAFSDRNARLRERENV